MSELRFSDGVNVRTDGPVRRLRLHDGLYVVGEGHMIPCADEAEVEYWIKHLTSKQMNYIVIENFGDPIVVVESETGSAKIFDDLQSAQTEANDCQDGIVVPLINIIDLLKEVSGVIDVLKFESCNEDDGGLEDEINEIIS